MTEATLDDRGRLTVPKEFRERFGDRYRIVKLRDSIKLIPLEEDPLTALRDEFDDVDATPEEILAEARETALDEAGH